MTSVSLILGIERRKRSSPALSVSFHPLSAAYGTAWPSCSPYFFSISVRMLETCSLCRTFTSLISLCDSLLQIQPCFRRAVSGQELIGKKAENFKLLSSLKGHKRLCLLLVCIGYHLKGTIHRSLFTVKYALAAQQMSGFV